MENGTRLRASVMRALESHLVRCICCLASASFIFFVVLYQNCAVQGSESHLVFTFGLDVTERFESLSQSLLSSHESHGSLLLSRRKREENKKHIEQSVKERQKVCVSLGLICLSKGWIIWGPVQIKCTFSPDKYHLVPRENNLLRMLPFAMKDERHPSPFNEYKSPVSNTDVLAHSEDIFSLWLKWLR